jgi:hypothetical protein
MNLFEILEDAGGGSAWAKMAPHFGMTEEQVRQAAEAFLPAFSAGLKRSTADPLGLMELMRKLSVADYFRAYQNPASAWGQSAGKGNDALAFLFGSAEVARQIAQQASAFTGIDKGKLTELMPALAAVTLGGLAQQAAALNPMFAEFMKQQAPTDRKKPGAKGPLDRYEDEQDERERLAAEKLTAAQAEMMQAGLAAFQTGAAAWQEAVGAMMKNAGGGAVTGAEKSPAQEASGEKLFGELLEPGVRLSEAYRREMEALLSGLQPSTTRS